MKATRTVRSFRRNVAAVKSALKRPEARTKFYSGSDRKKFQSLLRDHGFNSSEGRLRLLSVLNASRGPLTIAELTARCGGALDEVNVYRAIEAFRSKGIVRLVELQRGVAERYEINTDHHHHIVCTQCGDVKDFDVCDIDAVTRGALRQVSNFADVKSHSLELFGTCNSCVKK